MTAPMPPSPVPSQEPVAQANIAQVGAQVCHYTTCIRERCRAEERCLATQDAGEPTKHELALKAVCAHWNEFGPEHGFGEVIDRAEMTLKADDDETAWIASLQPGTRQEQSIRQDSGQEALDARRYRFIRDNPWGGPLGRVIAGHRNALWDEVIDEALRAGTPTEGSAAP